MLHQFRKCIAIQCLATAALVAVSAASAADWPQFQGPDRNGVSPETGLARAWPEGGPREHWRVSVGGGFAGPAIRDGEVYLLDRVDGKQDVLRCLALDTGEEIWRFAYDARGRVGHSGSRTTPTVTEQHVFTVGMLGHFYCFDRATHKPVWKRELLEEFPLDSRPRWGFAQSPSLYEDLVVVAPQSPDAYVAAFKQATGELVWKSESLGRVGYSTPVITTLCGVDQAVMVGACNKSGTEKGLVAGISMADGQVLWKYDGWQCRIPIPYPTTVPDDRLFITGGYGAGSAMVRIVREDAAWRVAERFTTSDCGSQIHQPLLIENHLYVNSNSNERNDGMMCLTLDGEVLWKTGSDGDLPDFERGNLLFADGMIISLDGKSGILYLVEPSPEGFREITSARIFDGNRMWAPMALSDGKLVLRSQEEMACLDLKEP